MPTPAASPTVRSTKPTSQQPGVEVAEVRDGRQLEKERPDAVGLELAFLPEVHPARQPRERERPEGQDAQGGVGFDPRIDRAGPLVRGRSSEATRAKTCSTQTSGAVSTPSGESR